MSSGYYRYRCKNFLTHNCPNWVWVNNSACAECVAAGREQSDSDDGVTIDGCTLSHWSGTAAAVDSFPDVEIDEEETWSNRQTLDYRDWNSRPFEN